MKLKYHIDDEKMVIIEKKDYSQSIFHEQYSQAINQIGHMLENMSEDIPNLIAFCGDRGDGKTSCMKTVAEMLHDAAQRTDTMQYLQECSDNSFPQDKKLEVLPLIDPVFFDKNHNVIEILLGQLYARYKRWINEHQDTEDYRKSRNVTKNFQEVKQHLKFTQENRNDMYDTLEELEILSAGVDLSHSINKLFEAYLNLTNNTILVIQLDDLDLNMSQAYEMCELIRKYLNNKHCLILMSVKLGQLIDAVQNAIRNEAKFPLTLDYNDMASKYVNKLIPMSCRINMPRFYDLCDYELFVYKDRTESTQLFHSRSVKEGILRKIFYTSRFLFYNSKGSVSLVVPDNLRSTMQLLALLFSMDDYKDKKTLQVNKRLFKNYLFKTWAKELNPKSQAIIDKIQSMQQVDGLNKYVIQCLSEYFDIRDEGKNIKDNLLSWILSINNYNYNISVGDVFYLVQRLEQSTVNDDLRKLLFFIKSYYSICLYENYDLITEEEYEVYPSVGDNAEAKLYKSDKWFEHTNVLQRLVAGGYFTYEPSTVLPPRSLESSAPDGIRRRDFKLIVGKGSSKSKTKNQTLGLTDLLIGIKNSIAEYGNMQESDKTKFEHRFRMAEFFILTTTYSIYQREMHKYENVDRASETPNYLTRYNSVTGYYVFDVLAPFYSLINIRYTYERFTEIYDIFSTAKDMEYSLYNKMINAVKTKNINEGTCSEEDAESQNAEFWLKRLMSNAIIRNAEVAAAMLESMKNMRQNLRTGDSAKLLAAFYNNIVHSGMVTYNRSEEDEPYQIKFDFLNPIIELLGEKDINEYFELYINDGRQVVLPTFDNIFTESDVVNTRESISKEMVRKEFASFFNNYRKKRGELVKKALEQKQSNKYCMLTPQQWDNLFNDKEEYSKTRVIEILQNESELFS